MKKVSNILITGASGGMGSSMCKKLYPNHHLICVGHSESSLQKLKNTITSLGGTCDIFSSDFSSAEETTDLIVSIKKQYHSIDWVIYSAGYIDQPETVTSISPTFNINVEACINIASQLDEIISNGLITISSTAGIFGNPDFPSYSASKGALNTFTKSIARKYELTKRLSISICPGPTNTSMRERIARDATDHQSPDYVASIISDIIYKNKYENGNILIARNENTEIYDSL